MASEEADAMKKVKICGIRREEDIEYINQEKPDYIGFVFADSRRKVSVRQAERLRSLLKDSILPVGVFVNEPAENILSYVKNGIISIIQLHGDETEDTICFIKERVSVPVIKAIRVQNTDQIRNADKLSCDYLLLDAYQKGVYGGTGKAFAWNRIPDHLKHPYFLAGGLNSDNIGQALSTNCYGVDISGGAETNGVKDPVKIKKIMSVIKNHTNKA
jgi:phosphoribosylanthranilate isomerase